MIVPDRTSARRRSPKEYTQSVSVIFTDLAKLHGGRWPHVPFTVRAMVDKRTRPARMTGTGPFQGKVPTRRAPNEILVAAANTAL